jgi:hypothetical protein
MGILWNVIKTETPVTMNTIHRTHTHYNIELTPLGAIVLFPVWFPLFVLFSLAIAVLLVIKFFKI